MALRTRVFRALSMIAILAAAAEAGAVQLKIATLAPDGSAWMNEVRRGAEEIEKRTDGRVQIRLYPGGAMGNDQAMLRKMRIGQLHGAMLVSSALASADYQLYGLPLIFRSYAEVDYVRERMDGDLIASIQANGYVTFGIIEGGFAYIMGTQPTSSLDDLRGRKAWIPEGDPIAEAILDAAGLSPVPLPLSDVLTGLQTGLIDTVAGPPVGAIALQWFTKARFLTDMPILYSYGSIMLSDKAFNKLSAADQAVVREVFEKVSDTLDHRSRDDNKGARQALVKQGVEIIAVTPDQEAVWQDVAARASSQLSADEEVDPKLIQRLNQLLAEYRAQHASAAD